MSAIENVQTINTRYLINYNLDMRLHLIKMLGYGVCRPLSLFIMSPIVQFYDSTTEYCTNKRVFT